MAWGERVGNLLHLPLGLANSPIVATMRQSIPGPSDLFSSRRDAITNGGPQGPASRYPGQHPYEARQCQASALAAAEFAD